MKKNSIFELLLIITAFSLSSCATIVAGGSPKIILDGDVTDPVTIVTEQEIYKDVKLPYMVKVSRHGIDGQRITVKSEKHEFKDIMLTKTINEWTFGNIILGGVLGWGIDLITNCVSKPAQKKFNLIELKKTDTTE